MTATDAHIASQLAPGAAPAAATGAAVRIPAMIGAALMVTGQWKGDGVFNMEQLDPDPFMDMLNKHGLPWKVQDLDAPLDF